VCVCAVKASYWLILFPHPSELTALYLTSCTSLRLMLGDYLEGRTRYHRRIVQVDHRGRKLMNVFGFLGGTKEEKGTADLLCHAVHDRRINLTWYIYLLQSRGSILIVAVRKMWRWICSMWIKRSRPSNVIAARSPIRRLSTPRPRRS